MQFHPRKGNFWQPIYRSFSISTFAINWNSKYLKHPCCDPSQPNFKLFKLHNRHRSFQYFFIVSMKGYIKSDFWWLGKGIVEYKKDFSRFKRQRAVWKSKKLLNKSTASAKSSRGSKISALAFLKPLITCSTYICDYFLINQSERWNLRE